MSAGDGHGVRHVRGGTASGCVMSAGDGHCVCTRGTVTGGVMSTGGQPRGASCPWETAMECVVSAGDGHCVYPPRGPATGSGHAPHRRKWGRSLGASPGQRGDGHAHARPCVRAHCVRPRPRKGTFEEFSSCSFLTSKETLQVNFMNFSFTPKRVYNSSFYWVLIQE